MGCGHEPTSNLAVLAADLSERLSSFVSLLQFTLLTRLEFHSLRLISSFVAELYKGNQMEAETEPSKEYLEFKDKVKRTVYIDNLSPSVTQKVLETALGQFGTVKKVQFVPNYTETSNIPNCALVEMETEKQVKAIIGEMTNYPFMMSGMPRPVRAFPAEEEMYVERPIKPGRKIMCRWMDPKDPNMEITKEIKKTVLRHHTESSFLLKLQLEEAENLARQQMEVLKANYKKYEKMDKPQQDGTIYRLARRLDVRITED